MLIFSILITLLIFLFLFLHYGAKVLVKKDNIKHSENTIIVLLMGSVGDRALEAADLYHALKTTHIIIVGSFSPGVSVLREKNVPVNTMAERSKIILEGLGVNRGDILILPREANSTKDEALSIREYLECTSSEIDSIILVTSKEHSFRSKFIFQQALHQLDITIFSAPTKYDPFSAQGWYRNRSNAKRVITEYIKLGYFLFVELVQTRRR